MTVTVGIIGGGQLGRMLALAGHPLGIRCVVLDPAESCSAGQVCEHVRGDYDDFAALGRFLRRGPDVVTYEFESVPVAAAEWLAGRVPVHPPPAALAVTQDRLAEKLFFEQHGVPVAPFAAVDSEADLRAAAGGAVGLPLVLKTRRFGYDGKGQRVVRDGAALAEAWRDLGGRPLLAESLVEFTREVSTVAARGGDGSTAFYALTENVHEGGILKTSTAPAVASGGLIQEAHSHTRRLMEALNYVGVMAVEWFDVGGRLLANEAAPRVHNSGHWTIEGAEASQFENHLRCVVGWPLGVTTARGHSVMLNLIGRLPDAAEVAGVAGCHFHQYGKESRPGRKVGHVTARADSVDEAARAVRVLEAVPRAKPADSAG